MPSVFHHNNSTAVKPPAALRLLPRALEALWRSSCLLRHRHLRLLRHLPPVLGYGLLNCLAQIARYRVGLVRLLGHAGRAGLPVAACLLLAGVFGVLGGSRRRPSRLDSIMPRACSMGHGCVHAVVESLGNSGSAVEADARGGVTLSFTF